MKNYTLCKILHTVLLQDNSCREFTHFLKYKISWWLCKKIYKYQVWKQVNQGNQLNQVDQVKQVNHVEQMNQGNEENQVMQVIHVNQMKQVTP